MTGDEVNLYQGIPRLCFPGTLDDRIAMLLYRVPSKFADPDRLQVIAEKLRDYAVFEPKLKHLLNMKGTLDEYCSSLYYQVIKRNGLVTEDNLDDFPSFEVPWRRSLSDHLQKSLVPSPDVTSSTIHHVLPVGVSHTEALKCFQSALPPDLKSPYLLTEESKASDDQCGSISITQQSQHIVIHIKCEVDPGVMSEVCKELRVGYRSVVKELSRARCENRAQFEEMNTKFSSFHEEIGALKELVKTATGVGSQKRSRGEDMQLTNPICKKRTCMNPVTEKFNSGAFKMQCTTCIRQSNAKRQRTTK
jgi:hypothetical protein